MTEENISTGIKYHAEEVREQSNHALLQEFLKTHTLLQFKHDMLKKGVEDFLRKKGGYKELRKILQDLADAR